MEPEPYPDEPEPQPADDEPEPQPADEDAPQRAPIATKGGDGPDMMQQLQMQQLERMQLAVEFLTTPAVRAASKEKKVDYLKKQLKISDKEVVQAFDKARDQLLQPAIDFLSNDQVRAQPIAKRVMYLSQKLALNDNDILEAFKRIGDEEAAPFFSARRVTLAVQFLANPALKNRPGDSKVKYLKSRLELTDEEVQAAFRKVVQLEQFVNQKKQAEFARLQRLKKMDAKPILAYYAAGAEEPKMVDFYVKPKPKAPAGPAPTPAAAAAAAGTPATPREPEPAPAS
jgi:hypothetical protein